MGELTNPPGEVNTATPSVYSPSPLESMAGEHIKKCFEASSKYWWLKHDLQKRLWGRYINAKFQDKDIAFSNMQLGRLWYICDVIDAVLAGSVFEQNPYGKIVGEGNEDFPGAHVINEVNGWQQNKKYIKTAHSDSRLHCVVTGTGVKLNGWEYYVEPYFAKVEKTMKLIDPNTGQPKEIPTGESEEILRQNVVDQLSCTQINEWHTFPPPGGTSPQRDPYLMLLVRYTKNQLRQLEDSGYLRNVDYIDEAAYGVKADDPDISDYHIEAAKKEGENKNTDKDTLWAIVYIGLHKYSEDGQVPPQGTREQSCLMIKPKYCDVMLKFSLNPYPGIPVTRDKYSGTDDEWYGRSFSEIVEKLLKSDEDMYGYVQDAARRELFRRTFFPDGVDDSEITKWSPDGIVHVPQELMAQGKIPIQEQARPQMMPNMQDQRVITNEIIDEVSGVLDFVSGGSVDEDEKATMTTARMNYLNKRFKNRMKYLEEHGLQEWMEWQVVLNARYMSAQTVAMITGTDPWLNPFKLIKPVMPLQSFDFSFEGASKAADNPVQAQMYKNMLDVASGIGPGLDEQGRMVQVNLMALFRQFVKKTAPDEDIDEFFMPAMGLGQMSGAGGGGNEALGAVTPGDMMGKTGLPGGRAGIRQGVA